MLRRLLWEEPAHLQLSQYFESPEEQSDLVSWEDRRKIVAMNVLSILLVAHEIRTQYLKSYHGGSGLCTVPLSGTIGSKEPPMKSATF